MTRFVSPLNILCASWALTFGLAGVALAAPTTFDLLPELLWREDIDLARFTWTGAVWLCIALGTYAMADQITALVLRLRPSPHVAPPPVQLGRIVFWVNAAMFVILLLWIALAARKTGGPAGLIALAQTDALAARDVLLDGKLFPGMRLVYAGLSGTGALAMAALALPGARYEKRLALAVILVNGALLLVLPLILSQRLLLVHYICALAITDCLMRRRVATLAYLGLGAVAFLAVWFGREALTNTNLHGSTLSVGFQKLAFYAVNDLWNSFAPLSRDIPHTYGALSLRAVAVITSTDQTLLALVADQLAALDEVLGGGEFSLLTTAYVDFGVLGGAIWLAVLAALFRTLYWIGQTSPLGAALCAQVGAALVLAPHAPYALHQNVVFSMLIVGLVARLCRHRPNAPMGFSSLRHRHG